MLRQQVLDRLVLQEIQLQRANHVGIKVTDETLNAAMEDVAKRNNLSLSQLPEALATQGIDYAAYRDDLRKEITLLHAAPARRAAAHQRHFQARSISTWRSRRKCRRRSNEYNVSHILIAVAQEATQAQLDAGRQARHRRLPARASSGEDFAKLAVAYSNSQTALEGGSLGWRKGSELPTFLTDVVATPQAGRGERAAAHADRLSHHPAE